MLLCLIRILLLLIFSLLSNVTFSQYLVANGDFEEENICTEYRVNCAPEGWISTSNGFSNYIKDAKSAYNGSHYMAIDAGSTNFPFRRTYICTQLLCRLRKGNFYVIEFYLKSHHPLMDSIGIYFTPYDFLFEKAVPYKIVPTLFVADGKNAIRQNDSSWQHIRLKYQASGTENFITIGNFSRRPVGRSTGINMENHFFIFLDDFSFTPADPNEHICKDWLKAKEEIYGRNERHEFLERMARFYNSRNTKPEEPVLSVTTLPVIDTIILPDIYFATAKSTLRPVSHHLLDSLANQLKGKTIDSLVIEGNTDSTGTVALNETLSAARATEVKRYLAPQLSLKAEQVITRGNASNKNIATNSTVTGRQKNRRVDIFLYLRQ